MALANLTARQLRVYIGADEQDWSLAAGAFTVGQQALSESGLVQVSGTLQILPVLAAPESLDPAENPARWRRGQPVRIETVNQAGEWVVHPQGRLFLLDEPELPGDDGAITLNLGCRLARHNAFEFDDDKTGVVVGTPTNSAAVAQSLLEANEIPGAALDLGTWPYSLSIPEGKGQNNSFVQQAGGLAYANDWRYLWQRPDGIVTASALDLSIAAPLVTVILGSNDFSYSRIKVDRSPPNRVKVAGLGTVSTQQSQPIVETSEVEGDRTQFEVGDVSCPGSGVISRSTSITSWFTVDSGATMVVQTATTLEAPRSAVAKNPRVTGGFPCSLIAWKEITEEKRFDLTNNGRLIRKNTLERQRRFTFTTKVEPILSYATTRDIEETPTYASDEVISSILVVERQARGIIDPESSDPTAQVETRRITTTWRQRGNQTWTKAISERLPKALSNSSPGSDPAAAVGRASTSTSNTGENQPPRAEFWDGAVIDDDTEFQGEAFYTPPGGLLGRTEKALYQVPYGFSDTQCEAIALKHVALIAGRHRAALIEFPVSDALLAAPPLFPCDVVFPDGEIRHYRIDGLSWSLGPTQASAVGTGILVATTPAPTVEVPAPVPAPLTAVAVVDSAVPVVDDDVPIFAVV